MKRRRHFASSADASQAEPSNQSQSRPPGPLDPRPQAKVLKSEGVRAPCNGTRSVPPSDPAEKSEVVAGDSNGIIEEESGLEAGNESNSAESGGSGSGGAESGAESGGTDASAGSEESSSSESEDERPPKLAFTRKHRALKENAPIDLESVAASERRGAALDMLSRERAALKPVSEQTVDDTDGMDPAAERAAWETRQRARQNRDRSA